MTTEKKKALREAIAIAENTRKPATIYKIRIMQAYADGFPIEVTLVTKNEWHEMMGEPVWNWEDYNYRIKADEQS